MSYTPHIPRTGFDGYEYIISSPYRNDSTLIQHVIEPGVHDDALNELFSLREHNIKSTTLKDMFAIYETLYAKNISISLLNYEVSHVADIIEHYSSTQH